MPEGNETSLSELGPREMLHGLLPLAGHHPVVHIIGYLSVLGVWAGTYWVVMQATGWHVNAGGSTAAGAASRRHSAALATVCMGVYVGFIWYKGVGNPTINLILPFIISYLVPVLFPELIYMGQDAQLQLGYVYLADESLGYWRTGGSGEWKFATPIFAGASLFIGLWPYLNQSEQETKEWRKKHWRQAWYEREYGND